MNSPFTDFIDEAFEITKKTCNCGCNEKKHTRIKREEMEIPWQLPSPFITTNESAEQETMAWEDESWESEEENYEEERYEQESYNDETDFEDENSDYESIGAYEEEDFIESFVPEVSQDVLRQRIDEYLTASKSEYTLANGKKVRAFSQFRISKDTVLPPEAARIKIRKALGKAKAGKVFLNDNMNLKAIVNVVYGRPTPEEVFLVTQALIDSGELAELRKSKPDPKDGDLIRQLQLNFGVGIDCAGYVQLAFIYAFTGSDRYNKHRSKFGLDSRMNDNLRRLKKAFFNKVDFLEAQTGDLFVLEPRKGDSSPDRSGHAVIVAEHTVNGDEHSFVVDASWGTSTYGSVVGGISRRTWVFNTSTGMWHDIHPLELNKRGENPVGPYQAHPIQGVYRPKQNPVSQKEFGDAEEFYSHDSEFDNYIGEDENPQEETEINLSNAIDLNRRYGDILGWNQYYDQINNLLLRYSGQQNISLAEDAFAQAVAAWQQQQGLTTDGIIGPATWSRMKVLLKASTPIQPVQPTPFPSGATAPSVQNVFDFNRWHAQRIIDSMNAGTIGTYFNSKDQLEKIARGEQVLNINPRTKIISVLPIIYHIAEQARINNYREIIIGSFIRAASGDGTCAGHCAGKCIDINFKGGSFDKPGAVLMVNTILNYLLTLPANYKKGLGFGLPLQTGFFGNQNLRKFHSVPSSYLQNAEMQRLISLLGIVFPDNNNHLHIQVKWS